jgi:hypothetical protein
MSKGLLPYQRCSSSTSYRSAKEAASFGRRFRLAAGLVRVQIPSVFVLLLLAGSAYCCEAAVGPNPRALLASERLNRAGAGSTHSPRQRTIIIKLVACPRPPS